MPVSGETIRPQAGDALIVTDVQNDFLPGGSLALAAEADTRTAAD